LEITVGTPVLLHGEPPLRSPDHAVPDARSQRPSLLADLLAAEGIAERQRTVKAVLHALGFEWLGYGRLAVLGDTASPLSFCTTHADADWVRRYFREAWHEVDPRWRGALQSSLPFVWTLEQLAAQADSPRQRNFVDALHAGGARSGTMFVLPAALSGEHHFVSLLSRTPGDAWMGDVVLGQVLTLGLCLHEFYARHTVSPLDDAGAQLNPVQRDILAQVARGSSDKQIAYELQMSSHAVDYHMRQLRRRFAVRNRVQLMQVALQK
jgi:DNA-binding CsgD family transcriptional regulator